MKCKELQLGPLKVWPPVILAPMAGVTNYPFRKLCRQFGAPLTVSEMITARPLVEDNARTLKLAEFGPDEPVRSIQLYGVDPYYMGEATRKLVNEGQIEHIDLNFGCPVKKVTRKGGGAALPYKHRLLRAILQSVVKHAGDIPVTIKFRVGIDADTHTYMQTGQIAQDEGIKAVCLHARTAAQFYSGQAQWQHIAKLKQSLKIPVLGNGDIWTVNDAKKMIAQTGCDGIVIGRGCLGNPWLFRDLQAYFNGEPTPEMPNFSGVLAVMMEHAKLMCDWFDQKTAMLNFRKHACWYTKGFKSSTLLRQQLMTISHFSELEALIASLPGDEPYPVDVLGQPRGKTGRAQVVALPDKYLDCADTYEIPNSDAEALISGG